jgi:hypothetical protein
VHFHNRNCECKREKVSCALTVCMSLICDIDC